MNNVFCFYPDSQTAEDYATIGGGFVKLIEHLIRLCHTVVFLSVAEWTETPADF